MGKDNKMVNNQTMAKHQQQQLNGKSRQSGIFIKKRQCTKKILQYPIKLQYNNKMQNTLIMNKIPLPRYFDGDNWNTVFKPTRKSIPKYLHQDLPQLKLIELKERFKQIGKFNCPRLEYFDDYIRKHNTHRQRKSKTSRANSSKKQYQRLEEELQYALLLCDKKSSVLDNLVNQAKSVKFHKQKKPFQKGRYFDGTIDLVFRNRKNIYLSQQRNKKQEEVSKEIAQRVEQIKLIPFT